MRNLILIFTLTILGSINLLSQINVTEREILRLQPTQSILNVDWCSNLEYYRDSIGITSTRSDILDSYALDRAIYFATVLDHTSRDKRMKDCIHRIPGDNSAHNKLFGNSIFFSAPDTLRYVSAYPSFKQDRYWITTGGEIMQEYVYSLKGKDKLSREDLVEKMIGPHHVFFFADDRASLREVAPASHLLHTHTQPHPPPLHHPPQPPRHCHYTREPQRGNDWFICV